MAILVNLFQVIKYTPNEIENDTIDLPYSQLTFYKTLDISHLPIFVVKEHSKPSNKLPFY